MTVQDEGFEHIWRRLRLFPQGAEFQSKTKARAIANYRGDPDSTRCLEFDFHDVAGMQIDSAVKLHPRAAYFRDQSRHNDASRAGLGPGRDENRQTHVVSGPAPSIDRVHFEVVIKHDLFQQAEVQQICRNRQTDREQAKHACQPGPPGPRLYALC